MLGPGSFVIALLVPLIITSCKREMNHEATRSRSVARPSTLHHRVHIFILYFEKDDRSSKPVSVAKNRFVSS